MSTDTGQWLNKHQKIYLLIGLVVVLGVAAYLWRTCNPARQVQAEPPLVRTIMVQTDNQGQGFKYAGEVRGRYESQLAFQIPGKISTRNVEVGSSVKAGQLLLQLDATDCQLNLQASQAQLQATNSKRQLTEDNLIRVQALYKEGAISTTDLEAAQNASVAAQAAYDQANAQYQQVANQLRYCSLIADQAGTITAIKVEAGQFVTAATPVVTLVKDGELEVEISVPENRVDELQTGTNIKVSFWALPELSLNGTIRQIAPAADAVARTFKVRIRLKNTPPDLKLGMTATVTMQNSGIDQDGSITLPLSAIYQTGAEAAVWVVKDGAVTLRPITISGFNENQVRVTSGLQAEDIVVTAGVHKLQAGQLVRLMDSLP